MTQSLHKQTFKKHYFRTYAKERHAGAIHELPLRYNEGFQAFLPHIPLVMEVQK